MFAPISLSLVALWEQSVSVSNIWSRLETFLWNSSCFKGILLCMGSANERIRYNITSSVTEPIPSMIPAVAWSSVPKGITLTVSRSINHNAMKSYPANIDYPFSQLYPLRCAECRYSSYCGQYAPGVIYTTHASLWFAVILPTQRTQRIVNHCWGCPVQPLDVEVSVYHIYSLRIIAKI